jgi:DNA-binding beta-propeller fold protein YncE
MRSMLFLAVLAASSASAAPGKLTLLALSKHDRTLAIVDPSTLKVLARVPVGDDPHEVIASEDGQRAYVSNYGFGALHTLAVIDLVHQSAGKPIDLGALRGPHGLDAVGGKLWFTAEAAKAIGRFDPATSQVDWIFGTGQDRTHMLHVSADQKRVITTNVSSATISIIDHDDNPPPPGPPGVPHGAPGGDWHETIIAVGGGSEGFDVTPDNKEAWVANAKDGTISIVDLAQKKVAQTIAANVPHANRLKLTPDGKRALISAGPELVIYDVATRKELKRIPIGHGSAGIAVQPDGTRGFVACGPDNYIAVIDLATLTMTGKLDVGGEPDGMAWANATGRR